jgi:hypothetical protein
MAELITWQAEREVVLSTEGCIQTPKVKHWLFPEMRLWNKAAICGSERRSALVRCFGCGFP